MGLLDRYRAFEEIDPEEINAGKRERRRLEKLQALTRVPPLDLSHTEWPDLPHSEIVNAAIFAARGRVNGYPDPHARKIRRLIAERHGVTAEQVVLGNGAAELLERATHALLREGDELLVPWPTYPLYPLLAQRTDARAVPVDLRDGFVDPDALLAAVTPRTRAITICNPNDPTATWLSSERLGELLSALPERVWVLCDEALVHFVECEAPDAAIGLLEAFPRLLVVRTFSKVYGLSGLRGGYAVGSPPAGDLLGRLTPLLGVNALTQAAVDHALRLGDPEVERRRELVLAGRRRVGEVVAELGLEAPDSQANFVWLRAPGMSGMELAGRLERSKVIVAPGGPLGDDEHVRASIRGGAGTERLVRALEQAVADGA